MDEYKYKYLPHLNGTSLIEAVIYVALLAAISSLLVNFLLQIGDAYHRVRAEREVLSNARLLIETIGKAVAQADEVYAPTSRFDIDPGQLSLVTTLGAPPEHTTRYLDFWVDNGRLWLRQEGEAALPLSASSVRVTRFRLERVVQGLNRRGVKVTLEVRYARPKFNAASTLHATTALRGGY
jgi:hypothetical protein